METPFQDPKLTTIDIRKDVNNLWDRACRELDRDERLVEFLEKHETRRSHLGSTNSYDSVAIPEARFKIVNGVQVPIPVTLLKDFDPCFEAAAGQFEAETVSNSASISRSASTHSSVQEEVPEQQDCEKTESKKTEEEKLKVSSPPQPAPRKRVSLTSSSGQNGRRVSYENVWIPEEEDEPESESPRLSEQGAVGGATATATTIECVEGKASPPSLPKRNENIYYDPDQTDVVDGATAASASPRKPFNHEHDECECPKASSSSNPAAAMLKNVQRSASTSNLTHIAKKFSFSKIGRKISDQVMRPNVLKEEEETSFMSASSISRGGARSRRTSLLMETSWPGTKNHSGPLHVYSRSKRSNNANEKWCVLGNANIRYFNHNDSMAEPKEQILLRDILSINLRENESDENGEEECVRCFFDIAFQSSSSAKLSIRTFGTHTRHVRDAWVNKLAQSLSHRLEAFSLSNGECSKLGWAYMKVMFAGHWHQSWISLRGRNFHYTLKEDGSEEEVDLKRTKNITLVKDIKNLNAPEQAVPVLVVDMTDRSLYLQCRSEKELIHWRSCFEEVAFNNRSTLDDQQLTKDGIPVIVEQCVNFVFRHGFMTEGIYRVMTNE